MTPFIKAALTAAALCLPVSLMAAPLQLTPADPQPNEGKLKPGLAVTYAYPDDVKTLADARDALNNRSKAGPALRGLSYADNKEGEPTMTAQFSTNVAADISGYIRFDAPGTYTVNFLSNDGIEARIGGQEVAYFDERHPCEPAGAVEVAVPEAGWYAVEALYFQRRGTACLMMQWSVGGGLGQVPDDAFRH